MECVARCDPWRCLLFPPAVTVIVPTATLLPMADVEGRQTVWRLLQRYKVGRTVLMTTHHM